MSATLELITSELVNKLKRKDCSSAQEWIDEMVTMQTQLKEIHGRDIDDEELMEMLYMDLPKRGYDALKVSFSMQRNSKKDPLTLEGIKDEYINITCLLS